MRKYNILNKILHRYIKLDKSYSCSMHYDVVYDYFDAKNKLEKIVLNRSDSDYYKKLMISIDNNNLVQDIRTIMKRCVSSKKLLKNRSF